MKKFTFKILILLLFICAPSFAQKVFYKDKYYTLKNDKIFQRGKIVTRGLNNAQRDSIYTIARELYDERGKLKPKYKKRRVKERYKAPKNFWQDRAEKLAQKTNNTVVQSAVAANKKTTTTTVGNEVIANDEEILDKKSHKETSMDTEQIEAQQDKSKTKIKQETTVQKSVAKEKDVENSSREPQVKQNNKQVEENKQRQIQEQKSRKESKEESEQRKQELEEEKKTKESKSAQKRATAQKSGSKQQNSRVKKEKGKDSKSKEKYKEERKKEKKEEQSRKAEREGQKQAKENKKQAKQSRKIEREGQKQAKENKKQAKQSRKLEREEQKQAKENKKQAKQSRKAEREGQKQAKENKKQAKQSRKAEREEQKHAKENKKQAKQSRKIENEQRKQAKEDNKKDKQLKKKKKALENLENATTLLAATKATTEKDNFETIYFKINKEKTVVNEFGDVKLYFDLINSSNKTLIILNKFNAADNRLDFFSTIMECEDIPVTNKDYEPKYIKVKEADYITVLPNSKYEFLIHGMYNDYLSCNSDDVVIKVTYNPFKSAEEGFQYAEPLQKDFKKVFNKITKIKIESENVKFKLRKQ